MKQTSYSRADKINLNKINPVAALMAIKFISSKKKLSGPQIFIFKQNPQKLIGKSLWQF